MHPKETLYIALVLTGKKKKKEIGIIHYKLKYAVFKKASILIDQHEHDNHIKIFMRY